MSSGAETGWVQMNLVWVKDEMDRPDVASTTCLPGGKAAADRDGSPVKPERQKKLNTISGKRARQTNICVSPLVRPDCSSCKSSPSALCLITRTIGSRCWVVTDTDQSFSLISNKGAPSGLDSHSQTSFLDQIMLYCSI